MTGNAVVARKFPAGRHLHSRRGIERGLLRYLYHRDEHIIILATFAMFLALEDVQILIWGMDPYMAFEPMMLLGSSEIAELTFDNYNLSMIGLSAVVAASARPTVSTTSTRSPISASPASTSRALTTWR